VLELAPARLSVLACLAAPEALDALGPPPGGWLLRVAEDEALLVGDDGVPAAGGPGPLDRDPDAIAHDVTDAWAAWWLGGEGAREAFARLSALPLPAEGFVQGEVAGVAAKVVARPDRLLLLVPSPLAAHVREAIVRGCADLGVREHPPEGDGPPGGEGRGR
jgi:hypothetical protein